MRKIKLIKCESYDCDACYETACSGVSDWEEISEEDFKLLKSWEGQRALNVNGVRLVVFEDVSNKVTEYIKDVKEFIKKEKERCAKLLEEEQKRRAQAKAKRDLAKAKKEAAAIEKAKKLLREAGEI